VVGPEAKTKRKLITYCLMGRPSRSVTINLLLNHPVYWLWRKVGPERFRAPEILFNPEVIGLEYPGVHQIIVDSIHRTDMDLRKDLYGSILLSGGTTLTKGFGDRLLHEVQRLAVKDMRIKIFAPPERKYTTWTGGSILAGLSTFKKVCTKKHPNDSWMLTWDRCGLTKMNGKRTQTSFIKSLHNGNNQESNLLSKKRLCRGSLITMPWQVIQCRGKWWTQQILEKRGRTTIFSMIITEVVGPGEGHRGY